MIDFVVGAIVAILVGSACAYLIKEKKRGVKCVGCSHGCSCCKQKSQDISFPWKNEKTKSENCPHTQAGSNQY